MKESCLTLHGLMSTLESFWLERGCVKVFPYDLEKGAGTMNPATFFRVLGSQSWRAAYFEPSRRPADGRYGENPQRLEKHTQFQVILKPSLFDVQDVYLASLEAVGIELEKHDVRFEEDNWEAPTLGASGVGWQVLVDGTEITQFTYFQKSGGLELKPTTVELTYGIERLALFLNEGMESFYELRWNKDYSFRDLRFRAEVEFSRFNFEIADLDRHFQIFNLAEAEAKALLEKECVLPAYDYVLKCSHTFNVLDARGAISATERPTYIRRIRKLACRAAAIYLESEKLNHDTE